MKSLACTLFLTVAHVLAQEKTEAQDLCEQWNALYEKMQYGSVDRKTSGPLLRSLAKEIRDKIAVPQDSVFYFPIENHGLPDVGGTNGSGFISRQYNFLHGNRHRGHPAHDIFIHDADQDNLDDNTKQPAYVVAMTDGIVIGMKTNWTSGDTLRGGNYLMVYNPNLQRYYYYAHNHTILVKLGDVVRAGTRIATVGRTGRNASEKRSPTHLHLMVLQITDEKGKPYNYYDELVKSKKVNSPS
ncbi:M23 family metallopeptidase [bacterium]|nr:M23 family metallopeptidase [bacterium]